MTSPATKPPLGYETRGTSQICVRKPDARGIVPLKREAVLKRINDMENEVGRLSRLLRDLRADILELTIE